LAEHRECMRHLYSNFKKHFSVDLFKLGLLAVARNQFEVTAKCDYITNNIYETFNSWIFEERHKPTLNLFQFERKSWWGFMKEEGLQRVRNAFCFLK
jgi:hypothetical protein